MITYKDRTFCRGDGCAKFDACPRALTNDVKHAAQIWWRRFDEEAPILQFEDPKQLQCYEAPVEP